MKLVDTQRSGNAWKVRLLAGFLGIALERETLSIDRGRSAQCALSRAVTVWTGARTGASRWVEPG